ncbi:MAG TPA: MBL fold metallo-hydrolase [Candidatus Binatia bacterium]|jgi:glyoxylase-like metal-dependent hydrolase (beta-lactamase superfamily II)|nr:MBL fold metallo-hydrolase [Candidatus Binatia bacterium]
MTPAPMPIAELLDAIDAGTPLLLLDLRNEDEHATWRIEGRRPVDTVHIPYFDFIEDPDAACARLPRDRPIAAICAKGGSSVMVAELLCDTGRPARSVDGGMVAYGEFLQPMAVARTSDTGGRFALWQLNRRGKGCLSYVVCAGAEAVVVDPSRDVDVYERFAAGLGARIVRVLDTHIHADHVSGGPALAARTGAPYWVGADEHGTLRHDVTTPPTGAPIRCGGIEITVVATPGHTPGSAAYLVDGRYLLTGDTLFVGGVGRPDLGGRVDEWGRALFHSLRTLAALPDDTIVLPAHASGVDDIGGDGIVSARLGALRRLPELQIGSEDELVRILAAAVTPPPAHYADIVRANLGSAPVDPLRVTEWELGRNQCAAGGAARS